MYQVNSGSKLAEILRLPTNVTIRDTGPLVQDYKDLGLLKNVKVAIFMRYGSKLSESHHRKQAQMGCLYLLTFDQTVTSLALTVILLSLHAMFPGTEPFEILGGYSIYVIPHAAWSPCTIVPINKAAGCGSGPAAVARMRGAGSSALASLGMPQVCGAASPQEQRADAAAWASACPVPAPATRARRCTCRHVSQRGTSGRQPRGAPARVVWTSAAAVPGQPTDTDWEDFTDGLRRRARPPPPASTLSTSGSRSRSERLSSADSGGDRGGGGLVLVLGVIPDLASIVALGEPGVVFGASFAIPSRSPPTSPSSPTLPPLAPSASVADPRIDSPEPEHTPLPCPSPRPRPGPIPAPPPLPHPRPPRLAEAAIDADTAPTTRAAGGALAAAVVILEAARRRRLLPLPLSLPLFPPLTPRRRGPSPSSSNCNGGTHHLCPCPPWEPPCCPCAPSSPSPVPGNGAPNTHTAPARARTHRSRDTRNNTSAAGAGAGAGATRTSTWAAPVGRDAAAN
ncbi:hypothetical protein B0H11DRAFT_1934977 [Mycena galericulata]|nr:hypothetical protein B0H11DRAFT_1934977 [Mycena galericulata]